MDIALLTANANQLRHVIQLENEAMRILNIVLISLSITLQVNLLSMYNSIQPTIKHRRKTKLGRPKKTTGFEKKLLKDSDDF